MITNFKAEYDRRFHLEEILTLGIITIMNTIMLVYTSLIDVAGIFIFNLFLALLVLSVRYLNRRIRNQWFTDFRDLNIIIVGWFIYFEHHHLVPLVNPYDIDAYLIHIDRFLFLGIDPTVLLESITLPYLTEFLQIAYASFYFLPFSLMLLLFFKRRRMDFHVVVSTLMLSFYICYVGYYIFPAIGPRFTLDHLQTFPLSGVLFYDYVRNFLDGYSFITRDCYPSGHALLSIMTALLAYKHYRPYFRIAAVWAGIILFSTVYLRYHYVIDVLTSLIIAMIVYRFNPQMVQRYIFLYKKVPGERIFSQSLDSKV
ncbi:MAG TPA: phosphatase PAP2 family protein [Spirochaetota bacterium]|nr:phosphatase PAP2 family protein [Spirochaetota bacterium]